MRYLALRDQARELREMDRLFNRIFDDFGRSWNLFDREWTRNNLSISEEKDKYVATGKLEGFKKKDINVTVDDNVLYVKGETKTEDKKSKESSYTSYKRVLYLGDNIDTEKIKASFKKGILKIELPKTKETKKSVKKISIE